MFDSVLIVGGKGRMGKAFEVQFQKAGLEVDAVDQETDEAAFVAKVGRHPLILVSVDMENTPSAIRRLSSHVSRRQLATDFTSVKRHAVPWLERLPCATVSSHPLFGDLPDFKGQNMLVMPIRPQGLLEGLVELYERMGIKVSVIEDWREHDRIMAHVQSLMHFVHLCFARSLEKSGLDLDLIDAICSPVYKSYLSFSCRILNRDPRLYSRIIVDNPNAAKAIGDYLVEAERCFSLVKQEDGDSLAELFIECRERLGGHVESYGKISDYLVERLAEYYVEKEN